MNTRLSAILGASALTILAVDFPAAAQVASDQPAAANQGGLEEIVVTARRKDEKLQTVPLSVTAISGKQLEQRQITTGQDLERLAPSLNVSSGNSRDINRFTIRGQGTTLFGDPGVIAYFSEVPLAANGAGPGFYYDLSSVQVLNGPQGTLFGRNTTGGAILFEPQRPTDKFEGWLEGDFGERADIDLKGAINVPVIDDKLLVRVAFDRHTQDGYTKNVVSGKDLDNTDLWAGRVGVTFRPTDNIENYLVYYSMYSHNNGTAEKMIALNPAGSAVAVYGQRARDAFAQAQALGIRQTAEDGQTLFKTYNWGIIDTLTWDVTDWLTVKNVAAYQETKSKNLYDLDGTPLAILQEVDSKTFANTSGLADAANYTEEIQVSGKLLDDKLSYQIGGFFEYDHPIATSFYAVNVLGLASASSITNYGNKIQSHAMYTQETYDLAGISPILEGLHLTAGFRYTWDYKSGFNDAYHAKNLNDIYNGGGTCSDGRTTFPNCYAYQSSPFRAGTYTVQLDYQIAPNLYAYFTARSGFKSGGFNFGLPPGFTAPPFGPEHVHDEEMGIKSDFDISGVKTRFNLDLFQTDYSSAQRQIFFIGPNGALLTKIVNAGNATIQGIDIQAEVAPFEGLLLSANYTYQKGIYDYFDLGGGFSAKGQFMPNMPRHILNLEGTYHLPIPDGMGDLSATASMHFQTTSYQSDVRSPGIALPTYGLLDLRLDWAHVWDSQFDVSLFVHNALDRDYEVLVAPYYFQVGSRPSIGFIGAAYGPPREFGASLRYSF
jgi:iron complex outermembrane receptor protein